MYGNYAPYYRSNFYPNMIEPISQPQPSPGNDMIWVLNETEAASYPVAPNASVFLWDKNAPILYVKSNKNGIPSFQVFELKERIQTQPEHECKCGGNFVKFSEFNALKDQVSKIIERLEGKEVANESVV